MTFTALPQVHLAVIERLRNSAAHMQLVTGVFDEIPSPAPGYPYEAVDDAFETPDRTFGQNGHVCSVVISIFTQSPSTTKAGTGKAGFAQGLAIAEHVAALLTDLEENPLVVQGHDVVNAEIVSIEATREADGKTRRVDVEIILTLEDEVVA